MARDPVWADPTANPYLFDPAGSSFDGISGALDRPTVYPDPTRAGALDADLTWMASLAAVPPTAPPPPSPAQPPTTTSAKSAPTSAPSTSSPADAGTTSEPEPAWSRTGTYAAGQVAAVGVDTLESSEPAPRRRGPLPASRRSEPTVTYQPVAVYRSKPGTLAAPTLEQTRAQQAADRAGEVRGSRPGVGRSGQPGRPSATRPGNQARRAARAVRDDRAAQRAARTAGRVGRRPGRSGRRAGESAQPELVRRVLGAVVIVALLALLLVGILAT